jgi:hypothetical protein
MFCTCYADWHVARLHQHRLPAYTSLSEQCCHYCSQLLRTGVLPVGRAWLADDGDTKGTAKAGDTASAAQGVMDVDDDVAGGRWIAFHLSCWDERPGAS